jgi:hypothetical protein
MPVATAGIRTRLRSLLHLPPARWPSSVGAIRAGLRTPSYAQNVAHLGRPDSADTFYAACSDDFDEDICGCPVCRRAAHDAAA